MKYLITLLVLFVFFFPGCKKNSIPDLGQKKIATDTLLTYTYHLYDSTWNHVDYFEYYIFDSSHTNLDRLIRVTFKNSDSLRVDNIGYKYISPFDYSNDSSYYEAVYFSPDSSVIYLSHYKRDTLYFANQMILTGTRQ